MFRYKKTTVEAATFHHRRDREKVLPVLYEKIKRKELTGVVEDALNDSGLIE
jgi:hypothetical protein